MKGCTDSKQTIFSSEQARRPVECIRQGHVWTCRTRQLKYRGLQDGGFVKKLLESRGLLLRHSFEHECRCVCVCVCVCRCASSGWFAVCTQCVPFRVSLQEEHPLNALSLTHPHTHTHTPQPQMTTLDLYYLIFHKFTAVNSS